MQKIIGTFVPVSALISEKGKGNFSVGLIFLDWLKKTRQSAWQMLPLNETQLETGSAVKHVPSPYKSYGIGLDPKYLPRTLASKLPTDQGKNDFITANNDWIHDYALFCALRDYFRTDDWSKWDSGLRVRDPDVLMDWKDKLAEKFDKQIIIQWQLHQSYSLLREKAKKLNITLIGDLSFYLSFRSPLVWAHQDVFDLQKDGGLRYISGVSNNPPTFFGRQVWGHPLYNWDSKKSWGKIIEFWQMRLRYQAGLFDLIRFDHARAFHEYDAMDLKNETNDRHRKGPGGKVFEELVGFGNRYGLSVFVEDDSVDKIDEMRKSLKKLKSPGIKIFRFALDEKTDKLNNEYADINHYPVNTVAYTTTHDTETLIGYMHNLTRVQKQRLAKAAHVTFDIEDKLFAKRLRDAILASPAKMVIIPMQDWLLTTERINIPGTELPVNDLNWNFHVNVSIENLPVRFV